MSPGTGDRFDAIVLAVLNVDLVNDAVTDVDEAADHASGILTVQQPDAANLEKINLLVLNADQASGPADVVVADVDKRDVDARAAQSSCR
jgi:hypothetical protein